MRDVSAPFLPSFRNGIFTHFFPLVNCLGLPEDGTGTTSYSAGKVIESQLLGHWSESPEKWQSSQLYNGGGTVAGFTLSAVTASRWLASC